MRHRGVRLLLVLAGIVTIVADIAFAQSAEDAAGQGSYSSYCAASQNPAACRQVLDGIIGKGLGPQGNEAQLPGGIGANIVGGGAINGIVQGPQPSVMLTSQPPQTQRLSERGQLEAIYSQRAGAQLKQFGYDLVGNGGTISALQIGAIQDDYILGQGDAIIVTLRGQENAVLCITLRNDILV